MYAPVRLLRSIRPKTSVGVAAGAAAVGLLFAATPFLIPDVASRYGVGLGRAGLISVVQVLGFAIATIVAPRTLAPTGRLVRIALATMAGATVASVLSPGFAFLLGSRLVAGAAGGIVTWIVWADGMGSAEKVADLSAIGPLIGVIGAPIFGVAAQFGDDRLGYGLMALLIAVVLPLPVRIDVEARVLRTRSPSRSNRVLLVAMFGLTLAGSSLFIYAAAVAKAVSGLGPAAASLAFSFNAVTGIIAARLPHRRGHGGFWLAGTGVSALIVAFVPAPIAFFLGMGLWGYCFWMGLPTVFALLSDKSLDPGERAGDAQSLMAFGRAGGPLIAGLVVGDGAFTSLGLFAGAGLIGSSAVVTGVERYRAGERRV